MPTRSFHEKLAEAYWQALEGSQSGSEASSDSAVTVCYPCIQLEQDHKAPRAHVHWGWLKPVLE